VSECEIFSKNKIKIGLGDLKKKKKKKTQKKNFFLLKKQSRILYVSNEPTTVILV